MPRCDKSGSEGARGRDRWYGAETQNIGGASPWFPGGQRAEATRHSGSSKPAHNKAVVAGSGA